MKCQICREQQAEWSWQPFGPADSPESYTLLGSHSRGFPVVKVCSSCKMAFQSGDFPVAFTYKGHHFVGENQQVKEVHVDLLVEGTTTLWEKTAHQTEAINLMKQSVNGLDLVALVLDAELLGALQVAPRLLEACQELLRLRPLIELWAEPKDPEGRKQVLLAIAGIAIWVQEAKKLHGESTDGRS